MKKLLISVLIGLFALTLLPQITAAQFGKQLIDYKKHNWKWVETEHFRIFFYEHWVEEKMPQLISWTETAYRNLTEKLDYHPLFTKIEIPVEIQDVTAKLEYWHPSVLKTKHKIPIFFYTTEADFWRTKTTFYPPIGAGAFAEQLHWRVVMPIIYDPETIFRMITHEVAHIFQFACWYKGRMDLMQAMTRIRDAVWYFEGFSQHLSGLHLVRPTDIYLTRLVVLKDFIPAVRTWKQINNYLINYNLAPHFFDWIAQEYSTQTIKQIFKEIGIVGPTDKALKSIIRRILKKSPGQIDLEFRDYLRNKYKHLYLKKESHAYGSNLHLVEDALFRRTNVLMSSYEYTAIPPQPVKRKREKVKFLYEPVVSPDGKKVAGWTVWKSKLSLVLADARDCTFIKDLTPGYSLRKYGVWPEFNPYFGEGRGLSWSRSNPDKLLYIAESLEKYPLLIIIDPDTKQHQKIPLPFSEPNSPEMLNNGQAVVFSAMKNGQSDLFLFNLEAKTFENLTNDQNFDYAPSFSPDQQTIVYVKDKNGSKKLFLLNLVKTDKNKQITFGNSNEIRPVFLTDEKILFLSDLGPDKIYNIYTLNLKTGKVLQLTDLIYGAVSVLPKSNSEIIFSAPDYRDWIHNHEFNVYQADLIALEPREVEFDYSSVSPSPVVLEEPRKLTKQIKKYKPEFYVQRQGMLGFDSWYGLYGQGFFWIYDLTGEHQFYLDFLAYGKRYQIINAGYYNLRAENKWGVNFSREKRPLYPWWYFGSWETPAIDEVFTQFWLNQNSLSLWKVYPLNLCNRLEFSLSAHSVKFDYYGWLSDALRAEFLNKYFQSGKFLKGSFGLVRDTVSYSSQTGQPMAGSAARLNLSYSTGNFQKLFSFELRKYFRLSDQSTLAWRGLLGLQNGKAIFPFIVGDFGELRGYKVAQFTGNRLFLTNLELRIPLIQELRTMLFRAQNVRGAIFVDLARVEWSDQKFNTLNYDDFSLQPWRGALGLDIDLGSITLPFFGIKNLHLAISKKFTLPKWKLQKGWTYKFYFGYSF